ncbi:Protein of unknown function [Erythrobacter sp. HL-111]|nr:MAG: Protein of unknown function (DUF3140) [Erythrobacteraceae bacterium HL-111]SDS42238.1 Protein of unknown function [Erythrobacter sp. HL-111]
MDAEERQEVYETFRDRVNMAPRELEEWLETEESKSVGISADGEGGESKGHRSGRMIVEIKRTRKDDLSDAQYDHMKTVNGYIARHTAQRPGGDVENSNWRYSLMNWGHDPLKD